jgi:hypothetical protein
MAFPVLCPLEAAQDVAHRRDEDRIILLRGNLAMQWDALSGAYDRDFN